MLNQYREYKTDADKVKVYEHRLRLAREEMESLDGAAAEWLDRYETKQRGGQQSDKGHQVASPTGTSIIDSLYSSLTAADVDVLVTAVGAGTRDQEYLASSALEKEWDECKVNERAGPAVKDSLLIGIGWVKAVFEDYREEQDLPRPEEDILGDIETLFKTAVDAGEEPPTADQLFDLVPMKAPQEVVLSQRIVVDQVPWDQLLYDTNAKRVEDVRWHCQVTKLSLDEVQGNPTFQAYCDRTGTSKKLKDLKTDTVVETNGEGKASDEDKRCTIYEMWDYETGTTCVFAKGSTFLLSESANPLAINDDLADMSPFVPLVLRRSNRRVRGISEMEVMLPTLRELDLYHSRLATYLERMAPKLLAEDGSVTEAGKVALKSQEYGAVVEYKKASNPPQPFTPPTLPAEAYGMPDKLEQALREATGENELMRGMFPDRKRTATETAEVVTASQARQSEKRIGLERFYTGIAKRILQYMQMFYTTDQLTRFQDWGGPVEWEWTADDIVFDSRLEVVLTPKEMPDRQTLRDQGMAMLNVFGPLAQQPDPTTGAPIVDMQWLIRIVAEKMGFKRRDVALILRLPEEQQVGALAAQQLAAGQQSAAAGLPNAAMVPGPMDEKALASATNQGTIPPEVLMAAQGATPVSPGAVEQVSKSAQGA